jgi:hypothetical protein
MAYNGRKEHRECRPHLRPHAQPAMIGMIGMGFIPMYKVMGLFIFFTSLLRTVWGGFRLIITICLRVAIVARYQEYRPVGNPVLAGSIPQGNKVMEEVGEKVARMLNVEASQDRTVEGWAKQTEDADTITRLSLGGPLKPLKRRRTITV